MEQHLKQFENHTQYEEVAASLPLPNIAYCANENEMIYNPKN